MQPNEIASKPEVQALVAEAETFGVAHYEIVSADEYERAAGELKRIKTGLDILETERKKATRPLDEAKRVIMDWFRKPEALFKAGEKARKDAMIRYDDEQARIAREAQRKLDEQAARERAKLEEQARKAAASGKAAKAEDLNERAAMVVAPIVQTERPVVSGISSRENWSAVVDDFETLVRAVATGLAPRACLKPDDAFLNRQARALKSELNYPGVRAVSARGIAASRQ